MAKPRPTPPVTTPYDILGLTPSTTDEQIKERFDSKMQVFAKSLENEKAGKPIHYAYAAQIATLRAAYRDLGSGEYENTKEKLVRMGREIDTGHNEEYERLKKVVRTRERFTQKYFESRGEQYEPFMVPSVATQVVGATASGTAAAAGGIAQAGVATGIKALVNKGWTMAVARVGALKAIGSAVGSVLGPIGTIIGGFILSAVGNAFSKLARSPEQFAEIMLAPLYSFIAMMSAAAAAAMSAATSAASSLFIATGVGIALIALSLFIIQAGGYMVPGGQLLSSGEDGYTDPEFTPDCPSGWPVSTDEGQRYYISQGPFTPNGWTHYGLEAIDVILLGEITPSHTIVTTHPGRITSIGVDSYGGLYIDMIGTCGGREFRSRNVHFSSFSPNINRYDQVERGTVLGIVGTTGYSTAIHDHYEFRPKSAYTGVRFVNSPIRMKSPFVPETPARGCTQCNIYIP